MVEASDDPHNVDCKCKCEGETYELFVGDKSLCTKEQCEQKVSECTTAESADFVSCMCVCGSHRELFPAERASECTKETCANEFPNECPVPAKETSTDENFPVFWTARAGVEMKLVVPTWNTKSVWSAMDQRRSAQKNAKM